MSGLDLIWYFSVNFFLLLEKYQFTGNEPFCGNLTGLTDHIGQDEVLRKYVGHQDSWSASSGPVRLIHYTAMVPLTGWGLCSNPSPNEYWIPYTTRNSSSGRRKAPLHRNLQDGENIQVTRHWDLSPCSKPSKYLSSSHLQHLQNTSCHIAHSALGSHSAHSYCRDPCLAYLTWSTAHASFHSDARGWVRTAELPPKHRHSH